MPYRTNAGLIVPIASTGATLGLALFQYPLFYSFILEPTSNNNVSKTNYKSSLAGRSLSQFWDSSTKLQGSIIVALSLISATSGALASRWLHTHVTLETTAVARWYAAGTACALGHLLFIPLVAREIQGQVEAGNSGKSDAEVEQFNRKSMRTWMMWHTVRTFTVDLAALVCFAEGMAQSSWIV